MATGLTQGATCQHFALWTVWFEPFEPRKVEVSREPEPVHLKESRSLKTHWHWPGLGLAACLGSVFSRNPSTKGARPALTDPYASARGASCLSSGKIGNLAEVRVSILAAQ